MHVLCILGRNLIGDLVVRMPRHDATAAVQHTERQRACMENTSTVVRPRSPFRCSSDSARSDADAAATGNSPPQPKPNSACAPIRNANVARGVGPAAAVSSAPAARRPRVRPSSGSSDDSQPYHRHPSAIARRLAFKATTFIYTAQWMECLTTVVYSHH